MGKKPQELSSSTQQKPAQRKRQAKKPKHQSLQTNGVREICRQRIRRCTRLSAIPEPNGKEVSKLGLNSVLSLLTSEELHCPICLELAVLPTLTDCGHLYCLHCAEDTFIVDKTCSVCRGVNQTNSFQSSETLKKIVNTYVSCSLQYSQRLEYEMRLNKALQIESKRKIAHHTLKIGSLIDFRRTRSWHSGTIEAVTQNSIVVSRKIGYSSQNHTFARDSRQIAPHGTFSPPTINPAPQKYKRATYHPEPLRLIDELSMPHRRYGNLFEVQLERLEQEAPPAVELPPWEELGIQSQSPWNLAMEEQNGGNEVNFFWEVDSMRYDELLPF